MERRVRYVWVQIVLLMLLTLTLAACKEDYNVGGFDDLALSPDVAPSGNSQPAIWGSPKAESAPDTNYFFRPEAYDPDGDRLGFSIRNRPHWANFDPNTGQLSGTPTADDLGLFNGVAISVSDGKRGAALATFNVRITESPNNAPGSSGDTPPEMFGAHSVTLSWMPPTENVDGTPLTGLAGFRIFYGPEEGNYPNFIDIPNPGIATYVVDGLLAGSYHFVTTAYALSGIESDFSNVGAILVQ